jgi:hypothetical protein
VRITFRHPRIGRCRDCGAKAHDDACDRERLVEHQVNGLEDEIDVYLASPRGRFESWWATRERRSGVR